MLVKFVAVMLSLAGTMGAQTSNEYLTSISAERWMSMCRAVTGAKILADGSMTLPDSLEAGQCLGALEAIGILFSLQNGGKPVLGICQPQTSSATQRAAIFINYLTRNPKRYGEPFAFVMLAAFQDAYPCPAKK